MGIEAASSFGLDPPKILGVPGSLRVSKWGVGDGALTTCFPWSDATASIVSKTRSLNLQKKCRNCARLGRFSENTSGFPLTEVVGAWVVSGTWLYS